MIRTLVRAAHVISMIFTPFCLPVVGMLVLFIFSYLSLLPWGYKGSSKKPAQTSCEYSCAGGITQ